MRQQAFKRATVIDLRGRYHSARKERFRLSRDDQVIATYFSWPPLEEESGHMIVKNDRHMRLSSNPKDTIICTFSTDGTKHHLAGFSVDCVEMCSFEKMASYVNSLP